MQPDLTRALFLIWSKAIKSETQSIKDYVFATRKTLELLALLRAINAT